MALCLCRSKPLNPFVFQTLQQLLDKDLEENTGVSRLVTGMNKDADIEAEQCCPGGAAHDDVPAAAEDHRPSTSHPVPEAAVPKSTRWSSRTSRPGQDHRGSRRYVPIDPRSWKEKRDVMVELRSATASRKKRRRRCCSCTQLFSQDPSIQPMYSLENRQALLKKVLEQQGILNVDEYLTPPQMIPPPQPDQMQIMQTEMAAKQLELQERQTASQKCAHRRRRTGTSEDQLDAEKAAAHTRFSPIIRI